MAAVITEVTPQVLARIVNLIAPLRLYDSTVSGDTWLEKIMLDEEIQAGINKLVEEFGGQVNLLLVFMRFLEDRGLLNDLPEIEEDDEMEPDFIDMLGERNW